MLHMISHGNFQNMLYGHPILTAHRPGKVFVGHLYHFIVAAIKMGVEKLSVNENPPTLIGQTELGSSNLERVSSIDYIYNYPPAPPAVKINPFDEYTWLFREANLGDFESMVEAARSYVIPLYAWRDEKANLVLVGTDRQWVWYTRQPAQTWANTLVAAMASLANDNSNFVTYAYGHSEEAPNTESGLTSWGFQLYSRGDWQDLVISTIIGSDRRERLDTKESLNRPILNLCGITSHYKEGGSNYNNYPRY